MEQAAEDLSQAWGRDRVLLAFLLCAVWCDGVIRHEEEIALESLAARTRTLHRLSNAQFEELALEIMAMANIAGEASVFKRALNQFDGADGLAESIFAHCADIVMLDRDFAAAEEAFLARLSRGLGLNKQAAGKIVKVAKIKNSA